MHLGAMGGIKLKDGIDISPFIKKRIRFEGSSLRSRDEAYQVLPPLIPLLKQVSRSRNLRKSIYGMLTDFGRAN